MNERERLTPEQREHLADQTHEEAQEAIQGREKIQRRVMLEHHLQHNHIPAIPLDFMAPAEEAIDAMLEGDSMREIDLPNGLTKTAADIVEGMHLDGFLPEPEDGFLPPA